MPPAIAFAYLASYFQLYFSANKVETSKTLQ